MPLIENGVYVDGYRTADPQNLEDTYEVMRARNGMAWIDLDRPSETELRSVANEFGLHGHAVDDALAGHQRAKLEHYGETLFVVLRPARYIDSDERVDFGELHVFVGPDFVVTIRHADSPNLAGVRTRLEATPVLLAMGPKAVLYAVLEEVVDEYGPVIAGLENDIDEIEDELFGGDPDVSRRIYELSREVINFQRAAHPLAAMVESLLDGSQNSSAELELQQLFRHVLDHVLRVVDRADAFRALLDNALIVHSTLVTQRQNDEVRRMTEHNLTQNEEIKKISSWAAILFAPTVIGTIYGMNFDFMPELGWAGGYPFAVGLMVLLGVGLYVVFKSRKWL